MAETPSPEPKPPRSWPAVLIGLGLVVFGIVALTGPGRIDIHDAQPRYEVGKNLVEHGDFAIRDPEVTFSVFPGRNGERHTYYRLPQSLVAAVCVLVADAVGPVSEARRQFYFSLSGSVAAAALAIGYALWFRRRGATPRAAIGWGAAGIFCTPNWFYATSTFDEVLGSLAVVAAIIAAAQAGKRGRAPGALLAGLLVGVAINLKPPMGIVLLPVAVLVAAPPSPVPGRWLRAALALAGVAVGGFVYFGFDAYKFPPEVRASHAEMLAGYDPMFFGNPGLALLDFLAGPASGTLWYAPATLLGFYGAVRAYRAGERATVLAMAGAGVVYVGFLSLITYYKGDPGWGPRYLTPFYAALWLFAPAGLLALGYRKTSFLLCAGCIVQLMALSVDPIRLYLDRQVPGRFFLYAPQWHFNPRWSHILNRPVEIWEAANCPPAPEFCPTEVPTMSLPLQLPRDREGHRQMAYRYQIFSGLRFWWASYPHLPAERRPVDLAQLGLVLGGVVVLGSGLLAFGLTRRKEELNETR